jgi:hypothetical protein
MSDSHRLSMKELAQTPEYQKLTNKQKLFVMTYCVAGLDTGEYDAVGATLTAYKCKTREIARIMSYSLMSNIRIIAVINLHFNATPTEEFMETLNRAIRNKNISAAQVALIKLKCDILGIKTMLPDDHTPVERKQATVSERVREEKKAKKEKPVQPVQPVEVPDALKGFLR